MNSVTVETKDISKVSKLIDTAIASGSNRVNGLTYGFDGEKKICTDLYPELVKNKEDRTKNKMHKISKDFIIIYFIR